VSSKDHLAWLTQGNFSPLALYFTAADCAFSALVQFYSGSKMLRFAPPQKSAEFHNLHLCLSVVIYNCADEYSA
jgi:hypothetical protein